MLLAGFRRYNTITTSEHALIRNDGSAMELIAVKYL